MEHATEDREHIGVKYAYLVGKYNDLNRSRRYRGGDASSFAAAEKDKKADGRDQGQ